MTTLNPSNEEIDLGKYFLVLRRQWKITIGVFALMVLSATAFTLMKEPKYEATSKLLFKSDRSTSLTGLGESLGRLEALTFQANPLDTQIEIIQSDSLLVSVIQDLTLTDDDGNLLIPEDLARNLKVQAVRGADVVSITYKASDSDLAAMVANVVAQKFIQENVQENRSEAASAREFISTQLPKTETDLNRAEFNLRRFKELNQIVALDQEAKLLLDSSFDLQRQLESAESQIASLNSRIDNYQNSLNLQDTEIALVLAALNQSDGVQQALQDLQRVEEEIAQTSALFTSDSQAIRRLNTSRRNLQDILQQRINQVTDGRSFSDATNLQMGELQLNLIGEMISLDTQRRGLVDQANTLSDQISRYQQRLEILPQLESQQSELERELEVAQTTYQNLLARFQELQVAESQSIGTARIMSFASPPENPESANRMLILAGGTLAGLCLAITAAFIADLLDKTLKTDRDIKAVFGYRALGFIPNLSSSEEANLYITKERWIPSVVTRDLPRSPTSEAYRILYTNLKLFSSESNLNSLVVTSSIAKEGKSEVAANLAIAAAQVGKKVLLIDADLRQSTQHRIWNISNLIGLSDILASQVDLQAALQIVAPNLSVLPSGKKPINPVVLLDSTTMVSLLSSFKETYDLVILDTPALLGLADSPVLGKLTDGILLVARLGLLDVNNAQVAKSSLDQLGQKVLGIVINDVDRIHHTSSYSYFGNQEFPKKILSPTKTSIKL